MVIKTIKQSVGDVNIDVVRGDTFNKRLFIYKNQEDSGDPTIGNLSGYEFSMQVRPKPDANQVFATFDNSMFYLGQTDEAIQYDIDNSNPAGTTFDELYILVSSEDMNFPSGKWYYDLQYKDTQGYINTVLKGRFILRQDVTRDLT